MVIPPKSPAEHNRMLGVRIPHPASTRFDEDDTVPAAKRRKVTISAENSDDDSLHDNRSSVRRSESSESGLEIPDSEEDSDLDDEDARHVTELESALPPIKTDKEAIDEYEAMRAAESAEESTEGRLKAGRWVQGKSSIYVDAFNLALGTVLEDESHLFDEAEMGVFERWRELDYEAQYLYVRLFLRKTSAWHRISKLGYFGDIADLPKAAVVLQTDSHLPEFKVQTCSHPGELRPPDGHSLARTFTFADTSDIEITTLEEASSLLTLDELKAVAKDAKVQGKNKKELLTAFRNTSGRQTGLGFVGLKRSDSEISTGSNLSTTSGDEGFEDKNRDRHFLRKIMSSTGPCIRLSLPTLKLFERVHLVFYRSTEWTDKSLSTIILARISRRNFPQFIVSRSANIFPSRPVLLEFEAALRTQFRIDNILEFGGIPTQDRLEDILTIFEEVYPRWKVLLHEEQRKEDRVYESGEGAYLRRFSPAWVYTRIIHKATGVLGKFKQHEREWQVLSELLDQRLFHAARRGAWYTRKALLEEHYMYALKPAALLKDEEQQKRHWKRIALNTCEIGLQDSFCHIIYHHDLQKRIRKLEKSMKIPKREQHNFEHMSLAKPIERYVEGIRVQKEYDAPKRDRHGEIKPRSTKTIWVDEAEGGGECSVEAMCLSWYRAQDTEDGVQTWKGYHAEGGILRTLFAYLFCDVMFLYIPNVFQTPYQTCPLDLHTDAFFPSRASEINHRLVEIANGYAERLIKEVDEKERENKTCIVGLNWDFALDDLLEIASCFKGPALATVCKVMAQEYQQRGGGIPDLFLWNARKKEVLFSEVKSENDRLSDTQRLWIHVLTGAGVRVELCNAVAREVRIEKG